MNFQWRKATTTRPGRDGGFPASRFRPTGPAPRRHPRAPATFPDGQETGRTPSGIQPKRLPGDFPPGSVCPARGVFSDSYQRHSPAVEDCGRQSGKQRERLLADVYTAAAGKSRETLLYNGGRRGPSVPPCELPMKSSPATGWAMAHFTRLARHYDSPKAGRESVRADRAGSSRCGEGPRNRERGTV